MAINIGENNDKEVTYVNSPDINRVLFKNLSEGASADDIADAVNAWIEEHPEAVTTVQDGSILPVKLDSSNEPSDGYVLSWNATAGKFEWIDLQSDITELKEDLNKAETEIESIISIENPITLITGHNIYTGSAVGQTASLQINVNASYSYALLDCAEGDTYKVKVTGGSTPAAWAFMDSNNVILAVSAYGAVDETIVAPTNAVKLAINDNSGNGSVYQITPEGRLDKAEDEIAKLSELIDTTTNIPLGSAVGKNIYTYGNVGDVISLTPVSSTNPDWRYAIYDCNGGDNFFVSVTGASSPRAWAFIDVDNKLLANADAGAFEGYIIAPTGTKKLIINDNSLQGIAYYISYVGKVSQLERQWNGKKWACVGDSLTEVNSKASKHYFDYVADRTGITIVNMGVGGSGYAKRSGESLAFYQRILNIPSDVDVITVFGSFNDYSAGLPLGDWDDVGTSTLAGCINTTLDNLYSVIPTAKVGIVTPTPSYAGAYSLFYPFENTSDTGAFANSYVDLLVEICNKKSIPCLDLFHCSNLRPWDSTFRALAYSNDDGYGTHPDSTGHEIISSKFKWFLDELIMGL